MEKYPAASVRVRTRLSECLQPEDICPVTSQTQNNETQTNANKKKYIHLISYLILFLSHFCLWPIRDAACGDTQTRLTCGDRRRCLLPPPPPPCLRAGESEVEDTCSHCAAPFTRAAALRVWRTGKHLFTTLHLTFHQTRLHCRRGNA